MNTPFLPREDIAGAAADVIRSYESISGRPVVPPIPVENIIEKLFGLGLVFDQIDSGRNGAEILGFIDIHRREIVINKMFEGCESSEGRLVFTCAHEAGHWVLHRNLASRTSGAFHGNGAIFCRTRYHKHPLEWQADCFASCLLMPENEVREAFTQVFGTAPVEVINEKRAFVSSLVCFDFSADNWPMIADRVRQAGGFTNVSKEAMIHRLQDLGLVVNRSRTRMGWRNMSRS